MMAVILALAGVAAAPLSIVVSEAGAPREGCALLEQTQRGINERVGTQHAEGGTWAARYVVTQSSVPGESEIVRLELSDPEGRVRLRRELPIEGENCADVAQAIALVVERYFADLAAEHVAEAETPESSPAVATPTPEPSPAPSPVVAPAPPAAPPPQRPPRALGQRPVTLWRAGVGAALLLPDPAARVDVNVRLDHAWWSAGLRGVVPTKERSEPLDEGKAELSALPLRLWAAADWTWDDLEVSLGPELLVSLERGDTVASDRIGDGTRLVLGLGAQANALLSLSGPVALSLAAGGDVTLPLAMSQFLVAETEREVLKPRIFEGFLAGGLVFSIEP
jgi:hypothetical protein